MCRLRNGLSLVLAAAVAGQAAGADLVERITTPSLPIHGGSGDLGARSSLVHPITRQVRARNDDLRGAVTTITALSMPIRTRSSGPPRSPERRRVTATVYFCFGSAGLTPETRRLIERLARSLRHRPLSGRIQVGGHTDSKGEPQFNKGLSQDRAEAVAGTLREQLGRAAPLLDPVPHGEHDPVAGNAKSDGSDNPSGRARNRRVEIVSAPTGQNPAHFVGRLPAHCARYP
jgi:outer membrane protein OmpA-like peptidoglycan-associated protein